MRTVPAGAGQRYLRFAVPAVLAVCGVWAVGTSPGQSGEAPAGPKPTEPKQSEKRVAFSMDGKPWGSVFEWLTEQTGKPLITIHKPTGTFSFISPAGRKYTIPEVIDIINEGLLANSATQKYYLINRGQSFTLIPADEKVDPSLIPQLDKVEDLAKHGETELVRINYQLKSLVAEDTALEVNRLMGPFGQVAPFAVANQLVLLDTVANLKRVVKTLEEIESEARAKADNYTHECKYVKCRDAERILEKLLGDPKAVAAAAAQAAQPQGRDDRRGFGPPDWGRGGDRGGDQRQQPVALPRIRMHYVSCDERSNTVMVTGPADKVAQAREIMKNLDKPGKDQKPVIIGPAVFRTYSVPAGNAEAISKTLSEAYKASPTLRISNAGTSTIIVYAFPEDQEEIAKQILGGTEKALKTALIPVGDLDPINVADTLAKMYGDPKNGAPFIGAQPERSAIVVKGAPAQVSDVETTVQVLTGVGLSALPGDTRVISLDHGNAAMLAEEIQRLLKAMRQNPVEVITPGAPPPKREEKKPEEKKREEKEPEAEALKPPQACGGADEPPQLDDPRKKAEKKEAKDTRPGDKDKPLRIIAAGSRLMLRSDDPRELALAVEIANLLTRAPKGKGNFEIIRLKNAKAADAAKVLDEAFNGAKENTQQQGGRGGFNPFFQRFGGAGAQPPATPKEDTIRVVADPGSNSLLVSASPLDMLTIRGLLAKAIDAGDNDSSAVLKTWVVGPLKFASAQEVSNVLKEVYREQTNQSPSPTEIGGGRGAFFRFAAAQARSVGPDGLPRSVALSIGVDDRTNSLILNCSEATYKDVKKLVEVMEDGAKGASRTVRVINIEGIDPAIVQQAVDAIQGRVTLRPTTGVGGIGLPSLPGIGMPGIGGPGMGGFGQPGMGGGRGGGGGGRGGRGFQPGGGAMLTPPGGPDFFADRVKDDPQPTLLYDPQLDTSAHHTAQQPDLTPAAPGSEAGAPGADSDSVKPVAYEEQQQPQDKQPAVKIESETLPLPRGPVTATPLEQLGVMVISGNNPADVEAVIQLIQLLQKRGVAGNLIIKTVPLQYADATSVTNTLLNLYRNVIVGTSGNTRNLQPTQTVRTQAAEVTVSQLSSVVLIPLPRFNAILLAAPQARVADVEKQIRDLDKPIPPPGGETVFPLKHASARNVATALTNWYAQRYPPETGAQNQVRITYDDRTNRVFVQAAPADLAQIRGLIEILDLTESGAINELRIVPLRTAVSDDLGLLLQRALQQGVLPSQAGGTGIVTTPGGVGGAVGGGGGFPGLGGAGGAGGLGGGGLGGLGGGGLGGLGGGLGAGGARPGGTGIGGAGGAPGAVAGGAAIGTTTKTTTLRFVSTRRPGEGPVESGFLDDIHITSDPRTNSLIISAPAKTMELLLKLIRDLDVPPLARAEINVFRLQRADAATTAGTIQHLFLGTTGGFPSGSITGTPGLGGTGGGLGGGGLGGGGLGGGGLGGGGLGGLGGLGAGGLGALGGVAAGQVRPLQLTLAGITPEGAPLIELRLTVDQRTNSLIVAGSRNDLDVIEAIVSRIDDTEVQQRRSEVYRLRNSTAVDVANALNNFVTNSLLVLQRGQQLTAYQDILREVIVVPEPITNKLLISATPRYFDEFLHLIHELDAELPQVVIQVLIAEVDLSSNEEFGVEIGIQSPVLFNRSVFPASQFVSTGTTTITAPTTGTGLVPISTTVNSSNPVALPGFNFNNPALPLGNNPVVDPGIVGFQGLSSLGVGRTNSAGLGGFVFSAGSNAFNLLIRALRQQGRIDVLSRPQVTALDNQFARVFVGQNFPIILGSNVTATGVISNNITYTPVGVELDVTPKISPDNKVLLRVTPQVSSTAPTSVSVGNGVTAVAINQQTVDTTVLCGDGETVAIGGLITRRDAKQENKIPWLGDLPGVGALFRFRTQTKAKQELLIIMTPHIVRSRADADRILAEESRRMDWVLGDVMRTQGPSGMNPLFPPPPADAAGPGGALPPAGPGLPPPPVVPAPGAGLPELPDPAGILPAPRVMPPAQVPQQQGPAPAPQAPQMPPAQGYAPPPQAPQMPPAQGYAPPPAAPAGAALRYAPAPPGPPLGAAPAPGPSATVISVEAAPPAAPAAPVPSTPYSAARGASPAGPSAAFTSVEAAPPAARPSVRLTAADLQAGRPSAQPPQGTDAPVAPGDDGKEPERWRSFRKR